MRCRVTAVRCVRHRVYRQLIGFWSNATVRSLKRKSGGTQEHAASAPHQKWCGRIAGRRIGRGWRMRTLRKTDRPLSAPRSIGADQDEGRCGRTGRRDVSAMKPRRPEGEGSDLDHVRPVLRQGFPFAIRDMPAMARRSLADTNRRTGRCEVPFINYPTRQLAAPRPNTMAANGCGT